MSTSATTKYIWLNGELVEWDKAQVHVMTHALHYGTSVFEGIRAYDTKEGTKIFRLDEHIQRLFNSAKIYWMNIPYTQEEIKEACALVMSANGLKSGYLRPLAFIGNVGLGVMPKSDKVDVMIGAVPWGAYLGEEGLQNGIDVCVSSWNRLAPNTIPTAAKAGGNYLSSLLIAREAHRNGFDEGIGVQDGAEIAAHFADADGRVLAFIDIVRPDDHIVVGVHLIKQVFIFAEADAQDAFRGLHIDSRQLLRAAPEGDGGAVCHIGADHRDHDRGENAETADQHLPHGTFLTACFPHCPSPLQN